VAECQLPKLDVAGSNPVARSKLSGPYGTVRKALRFSGHQMVTMAAEAEGMLDDKLARLEDHCGR
jgi:hypothetical protein